MRVPWWLVALIVLVGAASLYWAGTEAAARKAEAAVHQHLLDSLNAKSKADSVRIAVADSVGRLQGHLADSLGAASANARSDAAASRASARRALQRLYAVLGRSDTLAALDSAALDTLGNQLARDSASSAADALALAACDTARQFDSARIADRDTRIGTLTEALRVALTPIATPRFTPFVEAGVGLEVASGSTNAGIVVAGGVAARLIGPISAVTRVQYSSASKSGTLQELLSYSFGHH